MSINYVQARGGPMTFLRRDFSTGKGHWVVTRRPSGARTGERGLVTPIEVSSDFVKAGGTTAP